MKNNRIKQVGGGELTGKPKMTTFFPCKHKEDTPRIPGQHTIRRWKAVAGEAAVAYAEDVLERRGGELGGDAFVPGPRLLQRHAGRRRDDVGPHRREPPRRAPQHRGRAPRPPRRQRRRHRFLFSPPFSATLLASSLTLSQSQRREKMGVLRRQANNAAADWIRMIWAAVGRKRSLISVQAHCG